MSTDLDLQSITDKATLRNLKEPQGISRNLYTLIRCTPILILLFTLNRVPLLHGKDDPLRRIEEGYLRDDYSDSLSFCTLEGKPYQRAKILYMTGLNYMSAGSPCTAREFFRKAYNEIPSGPLKEESSVKIGDSFFLEDLYAQAEAVYEYFIKSYPQSAQKDVVLYKLACCSSKLGEWDNLKQSIAQLKNIVSPGSLLAEKVKELEETGFAFTVQAGAFIQKKNALSLSETLKRKGYDAIVIEDTSDKQPMYKVICGKYTAKDKATEVAEALSGDGYATLIYP